MSVCRPRTTDPATELAPGAGNPTTLRIDFRALVREDFVTPGRGILLQGFRTLFRHRFGKRRMSVRPKLPRAPLTALCRGVFGTCEGICGIPLSHTGQVGWRMRLEIAAA